MNKETNRDNLLILLFLLITLAALGGIKRINIDSGTQVFIPEDHEIKAINEKIEKVFGLTDSLIMGVQSPSSSVLERDTLILIDQLTRELEVHPLVGQVRSLTNMDYIESRGDTLVVTPVLEDFTPPGLEEFKRRIGEWQEVYRGTFISEDLHLAAIIIQSRTLPPGSSSDQENGEIYAFLRELAEKYKTEGIHFPIAGLPVVKEEINRSLMADILWLIPVAAFFIMIILFLSFRRWEGVLFPLISLTIAGIWVIGLMGYLDITFTMATLLVPVLLLVVGSAYAIHVLSHFYESLSMHKGPPGPRHVRDILDKTINQIKRPVMLAGLTTAGGFIALVSSPLGPFKAFGLLSAAGVGFSQITSLILLPLMLRIRYRRVNRVDSFLSPGADESGKIHGDNSRFNKIFSLFEKMVEKGKIPSLMGSILFLALTLFFLPGIETGSDMLKFFVPANPMVKDTQIFNTSLGGSNMVSLMITAPHRGDILSPSFLLDLEEFSTYITSASGAASHVQSVLPSLKRINQLMNAQRVPYEINRGNSPTLSFFEGGFFSVEQEEPDLEKEEPPRVEDKTEPTESDFENDSQNPGGLTFYEIPKDPAKYGMDSEEDLTSLLSQYLLFYSGNLGMVINDSLEPDSTLVTIQVRDISHAAQKDLKEKIKVYWDSHLPPEWTYEQGGGATLSYILTTLVTRSQFYSLMGAMVIVWVLVSIMFRSPQAGLYAMIPVLFSLAAIFLTMALFHFTLDIVTSLLASLAIGIGVDYAIHFMDGWKEYRKSGSHLLLNRVYRTTGRAILINALSVAFGFLSLMVSRFIPIRQMGILFSAAMISACFSSLIILPMALERGKPAFLYNKKNVPTGNPVDPIPTDKE